MSRQILLASGKTYAFSLQTQSLFNAGVPSLPHFVYTDHTHLVNLSYPTFREVDLFTPSWIACEKRIYQSARRVFTMSNHVRRSVIEQYEIRPEKVTTIGAGSHAAGTEWPRSLESFAAQNILFVGVDWERKGGPQLVEAFRKVLKIYPKATLTIVGCSPDLHVPNCTVVGRVPLEEVDSWYAKASVFCMPTWVEPFGIAFVEAHLHRLPVVAPALGALPDIVQSGHSGILVPPGDIDRLAEAIMELLESPSKSLAYGAAGYASASTKFTWNSVGNRLRHAICSSLPEDALSACSSAVRQFPGLPSNTERR
jgi:glycosyltransferase involved in cell wall biosynthesis